MSNIKTRSVRSGLKSEACLCILDIASSFFPSGETDLRPEKVHGRVPSEFRLRSSSPFQKTLQPLPLNWPKLHRSIRLDWQCPVRHKKRCSASPQGLIPRSK